MLSIKMEYARLLIKLLVYFSLFLGPCSTRHYKYQCHIFNFIYLSQKNKPAYFLVSEAETLQKGNGTIVQ